MKPVSQPHDPLDELLVAAVHGELTAAQRAELDALLQHDPAARSAYQEIQTMHHLLERNHRDQKPAPNFEDRMISGVRRKVREEKTRRETAWESALMLWRGFGAILRKPTWKGYAAATAIILILAGTARGPITSGIGRSYHHAPSIESLTTAAAPQVATVSTFRSPDSTDSLVPQHAPLQPQADKLRNDILDQESAIQNQLKQGFAEDHPNIQAKQAQVAAKKERLRQLNLTRASQPGTIRVFTPPVPPSSVPPALEIAATPTTPTAISVDSQIVDDTKRVDADANGLPKTPAAPVQVVAANPGHESDEGDAPAAKPAAVGSSQGAIEIDTAAVAPDGTASTHMPTQNAPVPDRKLIRDAKLDLQVKAYQPTVDAITALAKVDGGYLDSSNSQRGGNGKLQGTVVAKVAPDKLDAFLLKLRDLGELKNQSVSTEDVTKDYVDTQARIANAQKMEAQLQELLKHNTNKVADLLEVERELARVRGEIEQAQGQIKLYDFQVQYATVTITVAEKDLNKTAAYLLQEQDQFALFVHDVEDAFTQAKAAADTYKAQILNADLQHDSGNTMSATMAFSVPPDQVEGFLAKVKALGRVDNFTRTTSRVANDGGNPDQPADETRTDRDNAQVQLTIHADDESPRQQTQMTVASTGDIDAQAQQLKDAAAKSGAAVTASSFERQTDGSEAAVISFRLPLKRVGDLMPSLQKLGRVESLSVTRNDRPGEAAADPNAPAEIDLRLHNVATVSFENEQPRQATEIAIASNGDVDAQAQQLKADALKAGLAVTASTFQRSPDGTEQAAMTFRLPLTQAAAFTETLKKLGKVESLAIQRNDVTGPDSTDPNAPAEINLNLHSEPAVVAADRGVWPTLQHLFGGGVSAFLGSVETIGVLVAFVAPWVVTGIALLYTGRRLWVMRKSRA